MILVNGKRLRVCQFRTGCHLWSCWCYEEDAQDSMKTFQKINPTFKYKIEFE